MTTSRTTKRGRRKAAPPTPAPERQEEATNPLIDRYRRQLSEGVLEHWSTAALNAMGVRRAGNGDDQAGEGGSK